MKNIKRMIVAGCLAVSMGAASMGVAVHAQGPARPGPDPRAQHNPALRSPDVIEWGRLARGQFLHRRSGRKV
jgi:hypothetical protein